MRILVVEDDEQVASILTSALAELRYAVDVARDGQDGWDLAESFTYDLILLDMMLPRMDGISLCRKLRAKNSRVPILMLTARDTSSDKVMGLDAGADDYVVKPFNLSELSARIRALLRRGDGPVTPTLTWGGLELNPTTCEVTYESRPLHLSPKEYALLELFLRNTRRVFSRTAILDHVWSYEDSPGEDTVKAHIKGLRQKLKTVGASELIETVYGLGYRLKPVETEKPELQSAAPAQADADIESRKEQTRATIARAWEKAKEGVMRRVVVLEEAIAALQQGIWEEATQQKAEQEAHKLAGSVGMFGFHEGTTIARELEQHFQAGEVLSQANHLEALVIALRQTLEGNDSPEKAEIVPPPIPQEAPPLLLIVDDDTDLVNYLVQEATTWNLRTLTASDPIAARQLLITHPPDGVLLDLSFPEVTETGLEFLSELTTRQPPIPVLVFTAREGLADKVAVARRGGRAFLHKPVTPSTVLQTVSQVLQQTRTQIPRLLLVDDDPTVLAALRDLLQPWGFHITTLEDPREFWKTLEAVLPDLLVMDINMPHVDGIELCQVVRNDPQWNWLPILFLTAQTDAQTLQRVFAAGADDYISKPIAGPELVTRIHNRLERTKLLRSMAESDALTGTANRQKSTQELQRFLQWAYHHHHSLCLAVLDLDHCKQINEQYGHAVGDRLLQQMGKVLRQLFRGDDVVARWGGATFVVGMYNMSRWDGVERLAEALELLQRETRQSLKEYNGPVSFSAGVAEYPTNGADLQTLHSNAIQALQGARELGGARIHPAGWTSLSSENPLFDLTLIQSDETATALNSALALRGYHVQWISSLDMLKTAMGKEGTGFQTRLILLDIDFPKLNAEKLLKQMNRHHQLEDQRLLIFVNRSEVAEQFLQMGAYDYLIKPYQLPILLQRVRRALET